MVEVVKYNENHTLDIGKPTIYSGTEIDFNQLSDRNFEILLYQIFKSKIEITSELSGYFDRVMLMTGVGDRGQDCALFYNDKQIGLIQCKKYNKNIDRITATKEILKFVLYSFTDTRIFSEDKEGRFTYYFAISKGFANTTNTFLASFNTSIITEPQLKKWVEGLIGTYKSLSHLLFDQIENELKDKLSKLIIKPILPSDIYCWLKTKQQNLLSVFFEVQKVVNEERVIQELQSIKLGLNRDTLSINKITTEISDASKILDHIPHSFYNISNSHIARPEVDEIYNWIKAEAKEPHKNIALVVGVAGCGKSVIMRDVLLCCQNNSIPVLGLKSDKQNAITLSELTSKLNFTTPIVDSIRLISTSHDKIVLLIDQIDALSQYLSAKRDYIDTYIQLIHSIKENPKIKIIISTRKYDLENDPDINEFEKNANLFNIGLLTESQVNEVLDKINVSSGSINKQLYELLKTPVHLDLFCRIYNKDISNINLITTTYDLYYKFWEEKIIRPSSDKEQIKELLYSISQDMYDLQTLEISDRKYIDKYSNELTLLKHENVLMCNTNQIGFFHQSFYDFVYAKNFIDNGGNVLSYLNEHCQAITIRAGLKIILSYLRDYNHVQYISVLDSILLTDEYRFHIKYLIYSVLANVNNPTKLEFTFVEDNIIKDQDKLSLFLPLCNTTKWAEWIFENDILGYLDNKATYYNGIMLSVIYRFLNTDTNFVIDYINTHRDNALFTNEQLVEILSTLKYWKNDSEFNLIKELIPVFRFDNERHLRILENIMDYDKEFVFDNIDKKSLIVKDGNFSSHTIDDYYQNKFIEKLSNIYPYETCALLIELINDIIVYSKKDSYRTGRFIKDTYFCDYYPHLMDKDSRGIYAGMNILIKLLTQYSKDTPSIYSEFYDKLINNDFYTWHLVLTKTLIASPEIHQEKIVAILKKALLYNEYGTNETLYYQFWLLIKECFQKINKKNQDLIVKIITQIDLPWEHTFSKNKNNLFYPNLHYTSYHFLRAIPREYIYGNEFLRRHFGELVRKFGDKDVEDWHRSAVAASVVGTPLPRKAYDEMNYSQWKKSFLKYDSENTRRRFVGEDYTKGDIEQHSTAFKSAVKKAPESLFGLVKDIVFDDITDISYKINGLWGLIDSGYNPTMAMPLYMHLTSKKLDDSNTLYMMWMANTMCRTCLMPEEIFNYIVDKALHFDEKKKDCYTINHSMNSVQGAAIEAIIMSHTNLVLCNRIIDILINIANFGHESSKLSILRHIAYLNNIDVDKSLELFCLCTNNVTDETISAATWSLKYYCKYFDVLFPFYKKSIENADKRETKETILIYICHAWLGDFNDANQLLDSAITKWGDNAIKTIIEVSYAHISIPQYTEKCFNMLYRFLDNSNDEMAEAYSWGFLHNDQIDMMLLMPFINKYIVSKNFDINQRYFFDYLFKQSKKYPEIVLDILTTIDFSQKRYKKERYNQETERVKVVLGAFNSIRTNRKKYLNIATGILDSILINSNNFHYAINELDNSLM